MLAAALLAISAFTVASPASAQTLPMNTPLTCMLTIGLEGGSHPSIGFGNCTAANGNTYGAYIIGQISSTCPSPSILATLGLVDSSTFPPPLIATYNLTIAQVGVPVGILATVPVGILATVVTGVRYQQVTVGTVTAQGASVPSGVSASTYSAVCAQSPPNYVGEFGSGTMSLTFLAPT